MTADRVHVGTMGWSYGFWVGSLYPRGLTADGFLAEYARHFDTVEINSSFYRIPARETVTKWRDQTPKGFLFAAKFPREITHIRMLMDCEETADRFIKSLTNLGDKLGPMLLQFPPSFETERLGLLRDFFAGLPRGNRYAVEVRNRSLLGGDLYSILREEGVALAVVDSTRPLEVEEATTDFSYIRWEGDRRRVVGTRGVVEVDRTPDIGRWADGIKTLLETTKEVFGYFSKYYSGDPASDAKQLMKLL